MGAALPLTVLLGSLRARACNERHLKPANFVCNGSGQLLNQEQSLLSAEKEMKLHRGQRRWQWRAQDWTPVMLCWLARQEPESPREQSPSQSIVTPQ